MLSEYQGRLDNIKSIAQEIRVVLLRTNSNIGIDIALGGIPFEISSINRATYFEYLPNISLLTCSAEDLIIHKAFAGRAKDWLDIEGIILRQKNNLNWNYIETQLKPLLELKEEPQNWNILVDTKNKLFN